ncbi:hypothetical protein [Paraconexibacter sp. AEG42_29]|uniref:hypothetical protein n=1 Tax=Paraconexibacter sp. AEG42_29 TaxID=2997339 RepID=UPI00339D639B
MVSDEVRTRALTQPGPPEHHDSRSGRRRWIAGAAVATVTAAAAVIAIGSAGDGGPRLPGLADRAYAATTGPGVRHWRTDITQSRSRQPARAEGWSAGSITHVVLSAGRTVATLRPELELRTAGGRTQSLSPGDNTITERKAADGPGADVSQPFEDPMAAFRAAHQDGRLVQAGPRTYRVREAAAPGRQFVDTASTRVLTYEIDPRTALPRRLVIRYKPRPGAGAAARRAAENVVTYSFTVYERLPATAANLARLALPANAGKGPPLIDARPHFAVLRSERRLNPRERRLARGLATGFGRQSARTTLNRALDVDAARRARAGVILIPGADSVCMMIKGGGTCSPTETVLRTGLALSGTRIQGMVVAVPDGVRKLRARLPRHPWRTFAVRDNIATLPNGGYRYRLVH